MSLKENAERLTSIVRELLAAGHQVRGLARGDAAVEVLTWLKIKAHIAELSDAGRIAAGLRQFSTNAKPHCAHRVLIRHRRETKVPISLLGLDFDSDYVSAE